MGRYRPGIETRERILDATRVLLSEVGLEGATLKAICERAGIGAGSFYNLFGSKEEVVLSVVREAIAAVDPRQATDDETVADLVDAYLKFVMGAPNLARVYLQAIIAWGLADPDLAARFRRHHARRVERVAAALGRERPDLDAEEVRTRAELLLSTLNGLAVNWLLDPTTPVTAHRDRLVGLVLRDPGPEPSPRLPNGG